MSSRHESSAVSRRSRRGRSRSRRISSSAGPSRTSLPAADWADDEDLDAQVKAMCKRMFAILLDSSATAGTRAVIGIVDDPLFEQKLRRALRAKESTVLNSLRKFLGRNQVFFAVDAVVREDLQYPINNLEKSLGCTELYLLVHSDVRRISFDVQGTNIRLLSVHQQPRSQDQDSISIISGSSTFAGTRLDAIGPDFDPHKSFSISPNGIAISTDPSAPGSQFNKPGAWSNLPPELAEKIKSALEGTSGYTGKSAWWKKWKATAAIFVGLTAGATAFSLKATASGFYFEYSGVILGQAQRLRCGSFAARFSSLATAAGGAMAVGCAAGVAIYFTPWERFFGWLGDVFSRIWEACKHAWSWFTDWFTSWFTQFKEWLKEKFPKLRGPMVSRV